MASFEVPYVPPNPSSWGPPPNDESNPNAPKSKFHLLPYAPFGRSDRLGRSADFTANASWQNQPGRQPYRDRRRFGDDSGKNVEFQYKVDAEEQSSFQLVDTAKTSAGPRRFAAPARRRQQQQQRLRQLNARRDAGRGGGADSGAQNRYNQPQRTRRRTNYGGRGGGGRGGWGGRGGRGRGGWQSRVDRQASVSVRPDWKRVDEFDLGKLTKNMEASAATLPSEETDLLWCGFLDQYNEAYDKVSTRSSATLKRFDSKEFYPVTTTDDPVIENLAIKGAGNVFATDAILAHLMTCPRSVYPWDVVVQKLPNGAIFFDKRDAGQFDYLTVNETANQPPPLTKADDDPEGINTPERLSLEATMINQNFTQQILKRPTHGTRKNFDLPNPFFDEDDAEGMEPASVAYRYRRFDLGNDVKLVCRTELHGIIVKKKPTSIPGAGKKKSAAAMPKIEESEEYMTAFALNEFGPVKPPGGGTPVGINWRDKIDTQRGAVLATELKNNSFKLAKWTAQSILADAQQMKIGFVSRSSPKNAYEHAILATQFYRPREFATQITLSEGNMWGLVRMLVELFRAQPEGKYVLMRDPNKAVARVFQVPPGTFEEDDEEEEEEAAAAAAAGGGGGTKEGQ